LAEEVLDLPNKGEEFNGPIETVLLWQIGIIADEKIQPCVIIF
jgi:hypothetical protein